MLRKTSKALEASGDIRVDGRESKLDRRSPSSEHDGPSRPWWARWSRVSRPPGPDAQARTPADTVSSPEDVRRWIRTSVSRLDPGLRELLLMKILEGRSYREISEASGLSVTEVGRLTHRALKDLSKDLRRFATLPRGHEDPPDEFPQGPSKS